MIPEARYPLRVIYRRGDDARETNEGESGLGLAIAKSLVEAHGGSISVASTPGE